jgi:hypothetical protein
VRHPLRLAAALAAIGLAAPAAPALADGFTLDLAQQSDAVVGRPLIIQATGTMPPHDIVFPYWFSLDAIPPAATATCPSDHLVGMQFATATGGAIVTLDQPERPDAGGSFAIPVAVTPSSPGSVLLCGYTDDGSGGTLAAASLTLNIAPAPASGGGAAAQAAPASPVAAAKPAAPANGGRMPTPQGYARQGAISCRALMTGANARSCVRAIVRKANARCRRLHSGHGLTRCLRAVRREAKAHG